MEKLEIYKELPNADLNQHDKEFSYQNIIYISLTQQL